MAVSVKLDDELQGRLRQLAERRRRTPHWVMREAIREYVIREEARDRFSEVAEESWRHYQETGLHITGEELFAWMETWGTEDETDPPECHV